MSKLMSNYVVYCDGQTIRFRAITADEAEQERWLSWPKEIKVAVEKTAVLTMRVNDPFARDRLSSMYGKGQLEAVYIMEGVVYVKNDFSSLMAIIRRREVYQNAGAQRGLA